MVKAEVVIDTEELEKKITLNVLKSLRLSIEEGISKIVKDIENLPNTPPSSPKHKVKQKDKITGKDVKDLLNNEKINDARNKKFNTMLDYARKHSERLPLRIRNTIWYIVTHPQESYSLIELGENITASESNERNNRLYIKEHLETLGYKYDDKNKVWSNEKWA